MAEYGDIPSDLSIPAGQSVRRNAGDTAFEAYTPGGGGGSPGGSNKQVQFNNSGSFAGAAGFEYQSGASPNVLVQAQNAAHVPVTVQGTASQTANLQEWKNSAGTLQGSVSSGGNLLIGSTASDPLGIGTNTRFVATDTSSMGLIFGDFGSGQGLLGISNGTIKGFLGHTNSNEGFVSGSLSSHAYVFRAAGNNSVMRLDSNGRVYIKKVAGGSFTSNAGAQLQIDSDAATTIGLLVKGAASQTANLLEVQNSAATVRTSVTKDGQLIVNGDGGVISYSLLVQSSGTTHWKIGFNTLASNNDLVQLDHSNVRLNLGGGVVYYDVSSGVARIRTFNELQVHPGALGGTGTRTMSVIAQNAGQIPFAVQAAASQTANLQEWRNSSGTVQTAIASNGLDIILDTTTGTKIGTSTSQKLSLWNATPIVQPTTSVSAASFTMNTSGILNDSATFDGYTIGQVVKALRNIGVLA